MRQSKNGYWKTLWVASSSNPSCLNLYILFISLLHQLTTKTTVTLWYHCHFTTNDQKPRITSLISSVETIQTMTNPPMRPPTNLHSIRWVTLHCHHHTVPPLTVVLYHYRHHREMWPILGLETKLFPLTMVLCQHNHRRVM